MTLNGVMVIICIISPNSVAFVANYVKVVDLPSTDFLPRNVIKYTTTHDGRVVLFAVAELLVNRYFSTEAPTEKRSVVSASLIIAQQVNMNCDCADEHVSGGIDNKRFTVVRDVQLRQSHVDDWSGERR